MVRFLDKKRQIRDELLKCAQAGETPAYSEFGKRVGIPKQGPWKPILDVISREQTSQNLPDITFLVIRKSTGFPGQIGFQSSGSPTPQQKAAARQKLQAVFDTYCPGKHVRF